MAIHMCSSHCWNKQTNKQKIVKTCLVIHLTARVIDGMDQQM